MAAAHPRRWTVIASGLLVAALALVVIYTNRRAFFSPIALVVVAAIGLAAVLLQIRFRKDLSKTVHAPLWLNVLGIALALAALFADRLSLSNNAFEMIALGAVGCFSVSSVVVLEALRKQSIAPK